jgi:hypothetical protein
MPAFVIVQRLGKLGDAVDAVLCAPGALGFPDRKTSVPVRVRLVSEQVLCVDDEPRRIVSSVGQNGTTTYLVEGSSKGVCNRERPVALARASGLLQQLRSPLMPLAAESAEPELLAENLQMLVDWIARERERATTAPHSIGAPKGAPHDHAR